MPAPIATHSIGVYTKCMDPVLALQGMTYYLKASRRAEVAAF